MSDDPIIRIAATLLEAGERMLAENPHLREELEGCILFRKHEAEQEHPYNGQEIRIERAAS